MSKLAPSTISLVRSSILSVLSNLTRSDQLGPFGCRDIFLRAADILAGKNTPGVERPQGVQNFRQLLKPHLTVSFPNYGLPSEISKIMRETLWDLFVRRIITPAPSPGEIFDDVGRKQSLSLDGGILLHMDQLIITDHGAEVLREEDNRIQVYDPDSYLSPYQAADPPPDVEMMRYLAECINVFHSNYLIAAVVLLGASSERLVDVAAGALRDALGDPDGLKWYRTKYANKRDISARFSAFEGTLMREYGTDLKQSGLLESFTLIVKLNFEVIRNSRNSIAHPSGKVPNLNEVAGMLHNFSLSFDHMNSIINYLHLDPR